MTTLNPVLSPRNLLSILLASVALAADLSGATRSAPAVPRPTPQFEALPLLRSRQNHLLVRAFINGKPALLMVDTGAPISVISSNRRDHFQLTGTRGSSELPARVQVNGAFNSLAIARSLRLGALSFVDTPMVVVNLSGPGHAAQMMHEEETDGILGVDILFPTEAVLDCQRQLLVLKMDLDMPGHAPGFDYRGFRAVPIEVSDGFNLYVNAKINSAPAKLMVDTGAFVTLLHQSFVRRMRIPTHETPFESSALNLKQSGVKVARIQKLSVGSVDIIGKPVGVIDLESLIHDGLLEASPPVAGLLGEEILRRHHGIIDFGTRKLYLRQQQTNAGHDGN